MDGGACDRVRAPRYTPAMRFPPTLWRHAAAILAIPLAAVALLLAAEGLLRLLAPAASTGRFVLERDASGAWWRDNPDDARRHFPAGWLPESAPTRVAHPKPADTIRVVVLGESAAYGYPDPAFGLPRMLEAILEARHPGRRIEVVNAALSGVNSHALRDMVDDALALDPDALVVYSGNNECVGPFGPCNPGHGPPGMGRIRVALALSRVELPRRLGALRGGNAAGPGPMDARPVAHDDPALGEMARRFAANLAAIADAAARRDVPVVLATVPVNERDWAPFGADAPLANAMYLEGHAAAAEDPARAAAALAQALRRDPLRYRATPALNAAVRAVAGARPGHAHVADCREALAEASPGGVPGDEHFYDHCHLRPGGAHLVAEVIAAQLDAALPAKPEVDRTPPLEAVLERLGWTPWHAAENLRYVAHLAKKPPYPGRLNHDAWIAGLERALAEVEAQARNAPDALPALLEMRKRHPGDAFLTRNLAQWLDATDRARDAADYWRALAGAHPAHPPAWIGLARNARATGATKDAAAAFARACALRPDRADWRREFAASLQAAGDARGAIVEFRRLAREAPPDANAWRALAEAHARAGDAAGALAAYREGILHLPAHPGLHYYLVKTLLEQGDMDAARQAMDAAPPDPALAAIAETLGVDRPPPRP